MTKIFKQWHLLILLAILALSLQSCMGIGDNGQFKTTNVNNQNGSQNGLGINATDQAKFSGKIYFVSGGNLYVLDGADTTHTPRQLTSKLEVHDPAVSPDGKQIAFIARYPNYSDLMLMSSDGGNQHILRSGNGKYVINPNTGLWNSTHVWYMQPSWNPDGKHLLFLSDLGKSFINPGVDAFMLDLQVYAISLDNPGIQQPQSIAYAVYGDGGLRDASYRPGHTDQLVYTGYKYGGNNTDQLIQIYLEDPNAIANHPYKYHAGASGIEVDPGVALTPDNPQIANHEPAFSPDGSSILYTRRENATQTSMYIMPVAENITADPNNPVVMKKALDPYNQSSKLLTDEYISHPIWSPDGKQVAYIGYANNNFDIWLATLVKDPKTGAYSLKTDSKVQLTNANGLLDGNSRPCWTP
ncbi:MAG TPA: hypothetical protein VKR06_26110 [Ktedonosporobacter sp.]|nr:hypothetical protein [Ktedonosporobacter sp.]